MDRTTEAEPAEPEEDEGGWQATLASSAVTSTPPEARREGDAEGGERALSAPRADNTAPTVRSGEELREEARLGELRGGGSESGEEGE